MVSRLVAVGEEAPDFNLQTNEEKYVSLKDFRGKKIVLYDLNLLYLVYKNKIL